MIEFFNHHSRLTPDPAMAIVNKQYQSQASMLDDQTARRILYILVNDTKACRVISKMRQNNFKTPTQIVRQFIACNWDALDTIPDIADDNHLNFEYVDCGYKGANRRCPFSTSGDPKPYCIIKSQFNIPNYANSTNSKRHPGRAY